MVFVCGQVSTILMHIIMYTARQVVEGAASREGIAEFHPLTAADKEKASRVLHHRVQVHVEASRGPSLWCACHGCTVVVLVLEEAFIVSGLRMKVEHLLEDQLLVDLLRDLPVLKVEVEHLCRKLLVGHDPHVCQIGVGKTLGYCVALGRVHNEHLVQEIKGYVVSAHAIRERERGIDKRSDTERRDGESDAGGERAKQAQKANRMRM